MSLDMSPAAIDARLREASRLAGSLHPAARLTTKVDLGGGAVAARLREASDLLDLCRALATAAADGGLRPRRTGPDAEPGVRARSGATRKTEPQR